MGRLGDLPIDERLKRIRLRPCRHLPDAQGAISFAIARFHESWHSYRTITPTLYLLSGSSPGLYVTLGQLRRNHGLSWDTVDAVLEALARNREVRGYLVASSGVGGEPPVPLFSLQGHEMGERHYGALDLGTLQPFEQPFVTELDLDPLAWEGRWGEAVATANLG